MSLTLRFGNLTIQGFENATGVVLNQDDREWFSQHRTNTASFEEADKLHIFDKPLGIVAGNEIVHEAIKRLRAYDFDTRFYVESLS